MSRKASPKNMTPRVVKVIAMRGKVAMAQWVAKYSRPTLSKPPHEIAGGWIPNPRKLNDDSAMIAPAMRLNKSLPK